MRVLQTNIRQIAYLLFTCLVLLGATASAQAGNIHSISGIDDGDVISGEVLVSSRATGNINTLYYRLSGTVGMTLQRSGDQGFMIDDEGNTVAWDSATVPDGRYTLYVYALNSRGIDDMKSVSFRVDNDQAVTVPAAAPQTSVEDVVVVQEPVEEPVTQEPAVVTGTGDEESPVFVEDTSAPAVQEPAPVVAAFDVEFGNLGAIYEVGSGQAIAFSATGVLADNEDLLVLAWSVAESRMVNEFAYTTTQGPWAIPADRLALLPSGKINLQLMVREDGRIQRGVRRDVEFVVPAVVVEPPVQEPTTPVQEPVEQPAEEPATPVQEPVEDPAPPVIEEPVIEEPVIDEPVEEPPVVVEPEVVVDNFDIAFADKPRQYQQGSGDTITLRATGELPAGEELIITAWDHEANVVVDAFTFTQSQGPWVIPASKLDQLPANSVQLQLMRQGGNNLRVLFTTTVLAPVQQPAPEEPVVEEPVIEEPVVEEPVVEEPVVQEPAIDPVTVTEPTARFIDTPSQYLPGSGVAIDFEVQDLPAGGDVLIMAWSDSQGGLVAGFSHYLTQGPWRISASQMDLLPAGVNELQLIVRGGDTRPKTTHRLTIGQQSTPPSTQDPATDPVDPTTNPAPQDPTEPDSTTDPVTPGDTQEPTDPDVVVDPVVEPEPEPEAQPEPEVQPQPSPDLSGAAIGFTPLVEFADTQIIYVSSSQGNDSNNGLTEATAVRTLARGQALLRNGKPDWLLLRCGDVWDGQSFTSFDKSGAGADRPMVISTYGQGARPLIIPADNQHGFKSTNDRINGLVIQGLHIYGATRDPGSARYIDRDGETDGINIRIGGGDGKYITGLVIEDCVITHFDNNIIVVDDWARSQGEGVPGRLQCVIRRNIIRYASGSDSHSIGVYIEGSRDSIIEWNLIDHNGWAQTDPVSHRNKRSHNIYAQQFNGPIVVRHNILTRGAAHALQLRAGGNIDHNLIVRNALAFFASVNDSTSNYNVILESEDMNYEVPEDRRGVGIQGWGMSRYEMVGNVVARRVGTLRRPGIDVAADHLIVRDNRMYEWANSDGQSIVAGGSTVDMSGNMDSTDFGGQEPPYVDPSRSLETYAASIGIEADLEVFLDTVASRPRGVWIDELAPDTICRYIRNGFDLLPHD